MNEHDEPDADIPLHHDPWLAAVHYVEPHDDELPPSMPNLAAMISLSVVITIAVYVVWRDVAAASFSISHRLDIPIALHNVIVTFLRPIIIGFAIAYFWRNLEFSMKAHVRWMMVSVATYVMYAIIDELVMVGKHSLRNGFDGAFMLWIAAEVVVLVGASIAGRQLFAVKQDGAK